MATWNDGFYRGLKISTEGDQTTVSIYGVMASGNQDHNVETRTVRIPLETLKEMVNAQ